MKTKIFYSRFSKGSQEAFLNIFDLGTLFMAKNVIAFRVSSYPNKSGLDRLIHGDFPFLAILGVQQINDISSKITVPPFKPKDFPPSHVGMQSH